MRANTKLTIKQADIIINVPLAEFGSLDWRRSAELIVEGYKAAEAMRDRLLPLAVSADEYAKWQTARTARRRSTLPVPTFSRLEGFSSSDERQLTDLLARHIGVDFNAETFETDVAVLSGLDRYETITWRFVKNAAGENGVLVQARPKPYGPPFMMLGPQPREHDVRGLPRHASPAATSRSTCSGSGSELRIDGTLGSDPGLAFALLPAVRRHAVVRRAVRRHRPSHVQRDPGRRGGGELRPAIEPRRHGHRRQSRARQRSASRRLRRPAERQRRCRRSRPAGGQGQGDRHGIEMAP